MLLVLGITQLPLRLMMRMLLFQSLGLQCNVDSALLVFASKLQAHSIQIV